MRQIRRWTSRDGVPLRALRRLLLLALVAGVPGCSSDASSPTGPDGDPPVDSEPYDHTRSSGASAADILRGDTYDSLVVQVQYVEGFRPSDQGLAVLQEFLEGRIDKPRGISLVVEPIDIQSQATYTVNDVAALEQEHRTVFTDGNTLALYFIFLDGEYAEDANVLGFAYYNTSMAIFQEKIQDNTGGTLEPSQSQVEGIVLSHEAGHNLGLVDNGTPMQDPHRDQENGRHCDNENCLMYWSVRTLGFLETLTGDGPVLDQSCIDDLQANGGK